MSAPFELLHPQGLRIARGLASAQLMGSHAALAEKRSEPRDGWATHRLHPWVDGGLRLGVDLMFRHGLLAECHLWHDDDALYGSSWDDWSERRERQRARALRDWLAAHGSPVGVYGWGEIWAHYEPRSGFGGGGVRYADAGDLLSEQ